MSLITPDFGLLVWMTLIFGIVFFVLAKWGFPMITGSVEKRAQRIGDSIKAAKEAEEKLRNLAEEQSRMIEETRQEQSRILKEAAASRDNSVEQAKVQAREEASRILDQARTQIAAEKESALRDVRKEVALLSVSVAEMGLPVLSTRLPDSKKFRRDLSEERKSVFRSTIFPMDASLLKGSGIREFSEEISRIIRPQ